MTFCILITPFHLEVPFSYILLSHLHLGPLSPLTQALTITLVPLIFC